MEKQALLPAMLEATDGGQMNLRCNPKGCLRILAVAYGYKRQFINRDHLMIAQNFCDGRDKCSLKASKEMFKIGDEEGVSFYSFHL